MELSFGQKIIKGNFATVFISRILDEFKLEKSTKNFRMEIKFGPELSEKCLFENTALEPMEYQKTTHYMKNYQLQQSTFLMIISCCSISEAIMVESDLANISHLDETTLWGQIAVISPDLTVTSNSENFVLRKIPTTLLQKSETILTLCITKSGISAKGKVGEEMSKASLK